MARPSNCFHRADGQPKWFWHIRLMWFMALFTFLPPNTSWFYEQTSAAAEMQAQDCSEDTVLEQEQFALLLSCFCHHRSQQQMQFDSIETCSERASADPGDRECFLGLWVQALKPQSGFCFLLETGCSEQCGAQKEPERSPQVPLLSVGGFPEEAGALQGCFWEGEITSQFPTEGGAGDLQMGSDGGMSRPGWSKLL